MQGFIRRYSSSLKYERVAKPGFIIFLKLCELFGPFAGGAAFSILVECCYPLGPRTCKPDLLRFFENGIFIWKRSRAHHLINPYRRTAVFTELICSSIR